MNTVCRPLGSQLANDPVIKSLGSVMLGAPVVLALVLGWQMAVRGPAPNAVAGLARPSDSAGLDRPIPTQAILRPRRETPARAAFEGPVTQDQLLAAAFMPAIDMPFAAGPAVQTAAAREMPTASTPAHKPRPRVAGAAAGSWRMETLRNVGVADGLKLISDGAMLTLAGVEPLARSANCKRLDGVTEACATRALSRLEVLTRGRIVVCRVYDAAEGEPALASCRADKIDLADDLVKNGLARRAA